MLKKILLLVLLMPFGLMAQDNLENENITIIKAFEPILLDAQRPDLFPVAAVSEQGNAGRPPQLDYSLPSKQLIVQFQPPALKPIAYKLEEEVWNYNFWLKAGFGNLTTPLLDIAAATSGSDHLTAGVRGNFLMSKGNDIPFQDFRNIGAQAYAKWFGAKNHLTFNTNYDNEQRYYYGINESQRPDPEDKDRIEILQNTIGASVAFDNNSNDYTNLNRHLQLDYYYFGNNYNAREHGLRLTAQGEYLSEKSIGGGVDAFFDYTSFKDEANYTSNLDNSLLKITPYGMLQRPWATLKAGASLFLDGEVAYIFPDIYAEIPVMEGAMSVFGKWGKEAYKNSLHNFTRINPFLGQDLAFFNTFTQERTLGIKGRIGARSTYSLSGGQYLTKQQALFVTDYTDERNAFTTVYDSLKTIAGKLELTYHIDKSHQVKLTTQYNHYKTPFEAAAWHLPNLEMMLTGTFSPLEKLQVGGDLFFFSGWKTRLQNNEAQTLKAAFDLNLHADYHFSPHFAAFLNLNNLINNKYQRFNYYPVYGINFVGGIMLRF